MNPTRRHPSTLRRGSMALAAALVALTTTVGGASAHHPDPTLPDGPFGQNQVLRYRWRSGAEPTSVIKTAINAAVAAANATRGSKAATYVYDTAGSNPIGYGLGATCGVNGLACFTRDVPDGFTLWLREQGHVYDWGTLKWCQTYSTAPNGCYDAETIALDELGHVEGLNHHVNYDDDSDYRDAVVQTYSRTKASTGWNAHIFGRCDVATLQMQYDMASWTAKYSTCLDLTTILGLTASSTAVAYGSTTTLTASLNIADLDAYVRLGGNPVSGRVVTLQKRALGATTWTTVATMPAGTVSGTYVYRDRILATVDYRAIFTTPSDEGINGDTSPALRVSMTACGDTGAGFPRLLQTCL
jgi:hypothetical protein